MVDLGTSIVCPIVGGVATCNSVSVERLTLDAQGQSINGIVNTNAQTGTRVDHVGLYRILGTGLSVSGQANDSGPYSNIAFDLGGVSGATSTRCASVNGLAGTRGIHGLSCIAENNDPQAAVLLDSSNNSIKDVRILGFYDGIRVGSNANAESNVLVNITGDTKNCNPICSPPINTVHLAPYTTNGKPNVTDISILGATNDGPGTVTIADDLTSTNLTNPTVGIYALGESSSGGYTRFTTSPNAAHWTVGTTAPSSSTCSRGSLYSCTTPASNINQCANALWVCTPSGSSFIWTPIQ